MSIDFVPVVRLPRSWWPDKAVDRTHPLINDIDGHLLVVLMKFVRKDTPSFLTQTNQMRVSTSEMETQIIKAQPVVMKKVFMLLKAIKEHYILPGSAVKLSSILGTYIIKTTMLHQASAAATSNSEIYTSSSSSSSEEEAVARIACQLLQHIKKAAEEGCLPSFFIPHMNIIVPDRDPKMIHNIQTKIILAVTHLIQKLNVDPDK